MMGKQLFLVRSAHPAPQNPLRPRTQLQFRPACPNVTGMASPKLPGTYRVVRVEFAPGHNGQTFHVLDHCRRRKSLDYPPSLPALRKISRILTVADIPHLIAATNGPLPATPARGSPVTLQGPAVPNGKPTLPYVERSNPMGPHGQSAAQTVSSRDPKAAAQAASDMRNVVRRKLTGYVGFANLPNQWHRKSVRKGFNFNVMVVGTSS